MEQVKEQEEQDLDNYVIGLEKTVAALDTQLKAIQAEKIKLFEDYIDSLHALHKIGG